MNGLEVRSIMSSICYNDDEFITLPERILLEYRSSETAEVLTNVSHTNISHKYGLTLGLMDADLDKFYKLMMSVECNPRRIEASLSVYTPSLNSSLIDSYILENKFYSRSVLDAIEEYLKPEFELRSYDEVDKFKTVFHVTRSSLRRLTDLVWNYSTKETKFPSWNNVLFYNKKYDSNDLPVVMERLY